MRRPDEIALYAVLRKAHSGPHSKLGAVFADVIGAELGIHPNRVQAILEKWTSNGLWSYGVSARSGWFEPDAPEELRP